MSFLQKYIKENFIQSHSNLPVVRLQRSTKWVLFSHDFGNNHSLFVSLKALTYFAYSFTNKSGLQCGTSLN